MQALKVLARALEADSKSAVLWIVYLHIYYCNQKSIGKDDMFKYAVCLFVLPLLPTCPRPGVVVWKTNSVYLGRNMNAEQCNFTARQGAAEAWGFGIT